MNATAPLALCLLLTPSAAGAGEVVLDDPQAVFYGDWEAFSSPSCIGGSAARAPQGSGGGSAVYRPSLAAGVYEISIRVGDADDGLASSLPIFVGAADHTRHARVNLRAGGRTWRAIGEYLLDGNAAVTITDMGDGAAVADAVRFTPRGDAPGPGRTFHVAPGGSDSWPGTAERPWATLQKAAASLEAGDTVRVRAGDYPGGVTPLRTGAAHRWITFAAYPGETPRISGGGGHGFDLSGKAWVRVEGFRVSGNARNGIHLGAFARDIEILDCELDGNGGGDPWTAGLMLLEGCERIYVRGCLAHDNTGFGFASDHETPRASLLTLERCEARGNGNDGFGFYADRVYVERCVSRGNGWNVTGNGDDFDFLHSRDVILDRCACRGSNLNPYKLGGGYNIVVNCVSADTQNAGYGRSPGIAFLGPDSSGLVANCSVRGVAMAGAGPYTVRNCVIRKNGSSSAISAAIYCANPAAALFSDYNLFLPDVRYGVSFDPLCHRGPDPGGASYRSLAEWRAAGYDAHSLAAVASPYVNEGADDYAPRPGSPVIDAGTSDGAPLVDFSGCGRRWRLPPRGSGGGSRPYIDIGAVEYRGGGACAPPLALRANATSLAPRDTISVAARVRPVARPFDAYAVLSGPGGTWSMTPVGGLAVGIRPYAAAAALGQSVDAVLLDAGIPPGTAPGAWTVYAGLVPRRAKPSPANAFALDTVRITVRE